jgi:hypothetical protein
MIFTFCNKPAKPNVQPVAINRSGLNITWPVRAAEILVVGINPCGGVIQLLLFVYSGIRQNTRITVKFPISVRKSAVSLPSIRVTKRCALAVQVVAQIRSQALPIP